MPDGCAGGACGQPSPTRAEAEGLLSRSRALQAAGHREAAVARARRDRGARTAGGGSPLRFDPRNGPGGRATLAELSRFQARRAEFADGLADLRAALASDQGESRARDELRAQALRARDRAPIPAGQRGQSELPASPEPGGGGDPGGGGGTDPCTAGGGVKVKPPKFRKAAEWTRDCFAKAYRTPEQYASGDYGTSWPETSCEPPCVVPTTCDLPTAAARADAQAGLFVRPCTELECRANNHWVGDACPVPFDPSCFEHHLDGWVWLEREPTTWESQLIVAALAFLRANAGLVEWAVCLAASWSPRVPDELVDQLVGCAMDKVQRHLNVYLVSSLQRPSLHGGRYQAAGAATDIMALPPPEGEGVVLPLDHPTFQSATQAYRDGMNGGRTDVALCAVAYIAVPLLLHELLHLCGESPDLSGVGPDGLFAMPGVADDDDPCWPIQKTAVNILSWGLRFKYGCLQIPCCRRILDDTGVVFAHPEADEEQMVHVEGPVGQPTSMTLVAPQHLDYPWSPAC